MMKKITELTETKWRTVHLLDAYGNRIKDTEEYTIKRPVKSVTVGARIGHFMADTLVIQIMTFVIGFIFAVFTELLTISVSLKLTIGLINDIVALVSYPVFYLLCEKAWQRTPGKFLTKTVVIDEYGNKPEWRVLALRSLIRIVPFDVFSCLGDTYSHGWHDKWSKTWVVPEEELAMIKKLQGEQSYSL